MITPANPIYPRGHTSEHTLRIKANTIVWKPKTLPCITALKQEINCRDEGGETGGLVGKIKMTGEGQDQEKWLFWECWLILQPSALTVLRNEITRALHLTTPPYPTFPFSMPCTHHAHQSLLWSMFAGCGGRKEWIVFVFFHLVLLLCK